MKKLYIQEWLADLGISISCCFSLGEMVSLYITVVLHVLLDSVPQNEKKQLLALVQGTTTKENE